jgi:MYXO-CTERM domain-containing protein
MLYRLVADAAMVVHFAFLAYMALGGFLAWRRRRTIWVHLAVAGWGVLSVTTGIECPLTLVEDWGRRNAGMAGCPPAASSTTTSRASSTRSITRTWHERCSPLSSCSPGPGTFCVVLDCQVVCTN